MSKLTVAQKRLQHASGMSPKQILTLEFEREQAEKKSAERRVTEERRAIAREEKLEAAADKPLPGGQMKYKLGFEEYLQQEARDDPRGLAARMLRMQRSELLALIGTAVPSQGASPQTRKHELVDLVTSWRNYHRYTPRDADFDPTAIEPPRE